MRISIIIFLLMNLVIIPFACIAEDGCKDGIKLYDEEMLLKDLNNKKGVIIEAQKPLMQTDGKENQIAIEVPGSIKYNTSLLEEGAQLFRSGKYRDAANAFETALETYRREGFLEGEIAAIGNLYLTYLALGDDEKASEYLEEYRKKRRRK